MSLVDYMKVVDVASALSVTPRQVRKLIGQGTLRAEPLGPRLYLVERGSVEEYKRNRKPAGRPAKSRLGGARYTRQRLTDSDQQDDRGQ